MTRSSYYIDESDKFKRSLKGIPKYIIQDFKEEAYPQLRENPMGGNNMLKLRPPYIGKYRYKKGNYRLIYSIDKIEGIVNLEKLKTRGSAYR